MESKEDRRAQEELGGVRSSSKEAPLEGPAAQRERDSFEDQRAEDKGGTEGP